MKLSDFDYELPKELIAQYPEPIRDQARLMIVNRIEGTIQTDIFRNFPDYLPSKPALVFNNTQVIPAKLLAMRPGGIKPVEILLVRELKPGLWEAILKDLAKIKLGTALKFNEDSLSAVLEEKGSTRGILRFTCQGNLSDVLDRVAQTPLPPYIRRINSNQDKEDRNRYQTVFAKKPGAIAAPTAGLHFTEELMETLIKDGMETLFVTLHVGPGTFQPIRVVNPEEHIVEREKYHICKKTWNRLVEIKSTRKSLLAIGTTSARTLESIKLDTKIERDFSGWTQLFIHPGYRFKNVDHLITNLHLPKSTLFMLVCAFGGVKLMKRAYQIAITERFRFYSYGDAMLIL